MRVEVDAALREQPIGQAQHDVLQIVILKHHAGERAGKAGDGEVNAAAQETSILYIANGGVFADGDIMQQGVTDADGYARQPLAPTQEGYEFTGWYYDSSCTTPVDFSAPIVAGSGHATLFAGWAEVQAPAQETEIVYSANGGVFADGGDTQFGVADADGYARQPLAPTREGYDFAGWTGTGLDQA